MIGLLISFEDISRQVGLGTADLKAATISFINLVLGLLGLIAVIMILAGGFNLLISGKSTYVVVTRAKRILIGGIIGLIVVIFSWAIVNFVVKTTANVSGAA